MTEALACRLPLAFIPDGALAIVISFGTVKELLAATIVRILLQFFCERSFGTLSELGSSFVFRGSACADI